MDRKEQKDKAQAAQIAIERFVQRSNEWYERALCARPRSKYHKICCLMGDINYNSARELRKQNVNLAPTPLSKN